MYMYKMYILEVYGAHTPHVPCICIIRHTIYAVDIFTYTYSRSVVHMSRKDTILLVTYTYAYAQWSYLMGMVTITNKNALFVTLVYKLIRSIPSQFFTEFNIPCLC